MAIFKLDEVNKVNTTTKPESLSDRELSKMDDMILDKEYGMPTRRDGFSKFNTNNAGNTIKRLWSAPGTTNYIYVEVDAGSTHVVQRLQDGTGAGVTIKSGIADGDILDMATFKNTFYFVNKSGDVFSFDAGVFTTNNIQIEQPIIKGVIRTHHKNTGSLTADSEYQWILINVASDGSRSAPSQPFTHYPAATNINTTITGTNQAVRFDDIPVASDSRVVRKELFRTKANGTVFYFLATMPTGQTAYEDLSADTDLDLGSSVIYTDIPVAAEHIEVHKDRMFMANTTMTNKSVISPPTFNKGGALPSGWTASAAQDQDFELAGETTGSLDTSAVYMYRMVFLVANGIVSDYVDATYTTGVGENAITISRSQLSSVNKGEYSIQFYRTVGGGSIYYELPTPIVFTAAAYVDNVADSGLGSAYPSTAAITAFANAGGGQVTVTSNAHGLSNGNVVIITGTTNYNGTFAIANIAANTFEITATWVSNDATGTWSHNTIFLAPSRIVYSDLNQPAEFPALNFQEIQQDDGERITGIVDNGDVLMVFKETSIHQLYTQGSHFQWRAIKISDAIGCDETTSIQRAGAVIYFRYHKKAYKLSGGAITPIGLEFQSVLDDYTIYDTTYISTKNWYVMTSTVATGAISAFADAGSGKVTVTDTNHGLSNGQKITISGTTNYNGNFTISGVTTNTFAITDTWVANDATGTWIQSDMLVYDEKFGTFYKFNNGTNAYALVELWDGTFLVGGYADDFLLDYDSAATVDYASGGNIAIAPVLKSKVWSDDNGDNRLRKLNITYSSDASTVITLNNPQNSVNVTATDATTGVHNYRVPTDVMMGTLKLFNRLELTMSGSKDNLQTNKKGFEI